MGQMFNITRDQMNNWRWDNPRTLGVQVDQSNLQTTRSGKVKRTCKHSSLYGSEDLRAKVEPPSCQQYKPGDFLAVRPLNWDYIIDDDGDDKNWVDPAARSSGRSCPSDRNDNDDRDGEEDTQGGENGSRKGKSSKDGKSKRKRKATEERKEKGKGKGKGKWKGIVKQTPGGDDISRAVAVQLQQDMYEADFPQRCLNGKTPPQCLYTKNHTADWWWETQEASNS